MDNFFEDLDMSNFDDVANLIKTRVNSAAAAFVNKNYNDKILNAVNATMASFERLYKSAYSPVLPGGLLTTSGFIECDVDGKADSADAYDEKKYYNGIIRFNRLW